MQSSCLRALFNVRWSFHWQVKSLFHTDGDFLQKTVCCKKVIGCRIDRQKLIWRNHDLKQENVHLKFFSPLLLRICNQIWQNLRPLCKQVKLFVLLCNQEIFVGSKNEICGFSTTKLRSSIDYHPTFRQINWVYYRMLVVTSCNSKITQLDWPLDSIFHKIYKFRLGAGKSSEM